MCVYNFYESVCKLVDLQLSYTFLLMITKYYFLDLKRVTIIYHFKPYQVTSAIISLKMVHTDINCIINIKIDYFIETNVDG